MARKNVDSEQDAAGFGEEEEEDSAGTESMTQEEKARTVLTRRLHQAVTKIQALSKSRNYEGKWVKKGENGAPDESGEYYFPDGALERVLAVIDGEVSNLRAKFTAPRTPKAVATKDLPDYGLF